jgi:hypothetical protein
MFTKTDVEWIIIQIELSRVSTRSSTIFLSLMESRPIKAVCRWLELSEAVVKLQSPVLAGKKIQNQQWCRMRLLKDSSLPYLVAKNNNQYQPKLMLLDEAFKRAKILCLPRQERTIKLSASSYSRTRTSQVKQKEGLAKILSEIVRINKECLQMIHQWPLTTMMIILTTRFPMG